MKAFKKVLCLLIVATLLLSSTVMAGACTTIAVGKDASADGSTMISQSVDGWYDERIEIWCNYQSDTLENGLDLSDYSYILRVSASDTEAAKDGLFEFSGTDGRSFAISKQAIYDYAKKVYDKNYFDDDMPLDICGLAGGIDLVCDSICFARDNKTGEIRDLSFDGYLLCR